ncbi:MAG: VOC family protein [Chloroflexota bacterium]|nr:VOC family protein [Chloroflexota bacterium]MDE2685376.1 VOC family protein [Chloroflexota bacterium]
MATATQFERLTKPLVKITEMDHIVLRTRDVEESLRFYTEVLGMQPERVEQWRAGEVRFPSARLNADTIIDFFASDNYSLDKDGPKNQDHFCMVIDYTDMDELKARFEDLGVEIQAGPGKRWGSHGDGISLYIYDPDNNVVELRHY